MKNYIGILTMICMCFLFESCVQVKTFHNKGYLLDSKKSALMMKGDSIIIFPGLIKSSPEHSFIPIFLQAKNREAGSTASQFSDLILEIVSKFEKRNDHLKVTHWKIQEADNGRNLEGIWIDYEIVDSNIDSLKYPLSPARL